MSTTPSSPFMDLCGIKVARMTPGESELTMVVEEHLNNRQAMLHGGALATMVDCTAAVATWEIVGPQEMALTTDFSMTCLQGASTGQRLVGFGKVVHRGRRLIRAEVEIYLDVEPRKLAATAGVSFMVVARPD